MRQNSVAVSFVLLIFAATFAQAQEPKKIVLPGKRSLAWVAFNEKADRIAVRYVHPDRNTYLYEFPSLRQIGDLRDCWPLRFSSDGKFLATDASDVDVYRSGISVWKIGENPPKKLTTCRTEKDSPVPQCTSIREVRFSPDGKKVSALSGIEVHVWDWQEPGQPVVSIALPDACHWSGRLLGHDTLFNLRSNKPGERIAEVLRFDGKKLTTIRELGKWSGTPQTHFITPDGKHAVATDPTGSTPVINLEKPGGELADRMLDHWLPKSQQEELRARARGGEMPEEAHAERCYIPASAAVSDLSLIIHYYEVHKDGGCLRCGFGFFPRTAAKAKEFGIDLKKHTHLFLPVRSPMVAAPEIILSPDGRWLAFADVDLPPRIWEVRTLGKALLAEKALEKR